MLSSKIINVQASSGINIMPTANYLHIIKSKILFIILCLFFINFGNSAVSNEKMSVKDNDSLVFYKGLTNMEFESIIPSKVKRDINNKGKERIYDLKTKKFYQALQNADSEKESKDKIVPVADFVAPLFFDGFEQQQDFALEFENWTMYDGDGSPTYAIEGVRFPNEGYTGSFIIFNPSNTSPALAGAWVPHNGEKYAACFAATDLANDDWLISPQILLGQNSSVSFYVKSVTGDYGLERFRFGVSNSGNNPADFNIISAGTYVEAPLNWTKFDFDLSAYDNQDVYLTINCVSNNAFAFFVDDFIVNTDNAQVSIFEGEFASFIDTSTGVPTSWDWLMPGGDPGFSSEQNPFMQYNVAGSYDVSLTVSNIDGSNSTTKNNFVTVQGRAPIADFYIHDYDGFTNDRFQPFIPKGATVQYMDASYRVPTQWNWTFKSGTPLNSIQANPAAVTYNNQGRFNVRLEVENNFGNDILTGERLVNVGCCDYITNILPLDGFTYYPLAVDGYLPGHNAYEMSAYAEKFTTLNSGEINSLDIFVIIADGSSDVVISVWDDNGGLPGTLLGSKTQTIDQFVPTEWNAVVFDTPIPVSGNFYVGYQINYDNPHDFVNHMFLPAMMQDRGPGAPESIYTLYGTDWHNIDVLFGGLTSALAIIPNYCFSGAEFMTYNIEATSGTNGSISPAGIVPVSQGNNQAFAITPDFGYHVESVVVDNINIGPQESYVFEQVWDNFSIHANFNINFYEIRATSGPNGIISPEGNVNVTHGDNMSFDIIPDVGYEIDDVLVNGVSVGPVNSYDFINLTDNATIEASFKIITFFVYATSGANGVIMPEGNVEVNYGSDPPFNIFPDSGFYVGNVLVDNTSVGASSSYQFFDVTSNHFIHAIFTNSNIPGDVNGDGFVDVRDIVWLVLHINGNSPSGFIYLNSDINDDSLVNTSDLTLLIDIILGNRTHSNDVERNSDTGYMPLFEDSSYSGPHPGDISFQDNYVFEPSLMINNDTIILNSEGNLTALHFVLHTENTENIETKMLIPGYRLSCHPKEGEYSCVIYSMSLTPFPGGELKLIEISGLDEDNYMWSKIDAADVDHNSIVVKGL